MRFLVKFIYFCNMKYIDKIKKYYYKNLFFSCGKNLRIYGHVNIKNPSNGNNVIIGAGSIVTKDIPSNVIAVGNPAKILRKLS